MKDTYRNNYIRVRISIYLGTYYIKKFISAGNLVNFISVFISKLYEFRSSPGVESYFTKEELENYLKYITKIQSIKKN
ncbi:MAG: hypothetical protein Satyrvirus30_10 [Satyrvirus sp.]|uniref:Uncharacterized protein n=1 Tax=Satyrvirus sp. TaxID=2487771 RepID=A0A3G5AEP2_9VIRU|nr:MAG: hypothetical protein Satyrvirus30_10 [Satyrvirus sp.]